MLGVKPGCAELLQLARRLLNSPSLVTVGLPVDDLNIDCGDSSPALNDE